VPGSSRLVAPQGFTGIENKRDMAVSHGFPQTVPHTQNKDSYPDLLHNFVGLFRTTWLALRPTR